MSGKHDAWRMIALAFFMKENISQSILANLRDPQAPFSLSKEINDYVGSLVFSPRDTHSFSKFS
jgi:hypothetical protein